MRELRKDVDSGLESTKEELDNMDEMKIEEVLMGLKGLKQEEVFSFLGKNNFTPAETEMSSSGFNSYEHLPTVDSVEIEQLQLSLSAHFDGIQGSVGHVIGPKSDLRSKIKTESKSTTIVPEITAKSHSAVSEWSAEDTHYQRVSSSWPNEEEIIATSIGEELICTSNPDDEDFKYLPNNAYVIQSSVDRVEVPDKPKPIKLLIKRVESEDEVPACPDSDSSVTRAKSKRAWNSSSKRKAEEPLAKKKKCTRRSLPKTKGRLSSASMKKEPGSYEELEFSFTNTVHQDDEFVYPSLDMSDDEEDVYSFSQRDDTTWTPKIKMKINEVKSQRPTRNRKQNSAVAKYLEAAALKRAVPACNKSKKSSRCRLTSNSATTSQDGAADYPFEAVATCSRSPQQQQLPHSLPSTSSAVVLETSTSLLLPPCYPPVSAEFAAALSSPSAASALSSSATSDSLSTSSPQAPARRGRKAKPKPNPKAHKLHLRADFKGSRLIPPKTCKLLQTSRSAVVAALQPGGPAKQRLKGDEGDAPSTSSPGSAEKKVPSSYITKRGKPKKGMATAKQRLGKILKMHKMFY